MILRQIIYKYTISCYFLRNIINIGELIVFCNGRCTFNTRATLHTSKKPLFTEAATQS